MNIRKRVALLIGLSGLFAIVAPITILLSLGYRYDASTGRLQHTGILTVGSLPRQAEIFLNGKKTDATTPATLRYLVPGEYDLRLHKSGYQSWEKHFTILADRLTQANLPDRPVTLFRANPLPTLVATSTLDLIINRDTVFALAATSTLYLQNLTSGEKNFTAIPSDPETDTTITASDQNWIIVKHRGAFLAITSNLSTPLPALTINISALQPDATEVQPLDKNTLLILTKSHALLAYDSRTKSLTTRHRHIHAMRAAGSRIYYVNDTGLMNQNTASTTRKKLADIPFIPASANLITTPPGYVFVLLDRNLYALGKNLQLLAGDILDARWDEELGRLLLWNLNSVLLFDTRSGIGPETVIRSTLPISQPLLHPTDGVIFYEENQKLKAIELQLIIRRVITELLAFDTPIKKFVVDREGKTVYYLRTDKKLFKIEIR